MPTPLPTDPPAAHESRGVRVDRYQLRQRLGEGGGGVVYAADQDKPVRRQVALKILKLGMDTRAVVARFEAERQALALMDHPNIARILDAGATEDGRPYFVMELVPGPRITEFCDRRRLTVDARISLFITVCQAVQHAHQKGVIHRDLKPSNVLVLEPEDPSSPACPKVIDFGIAKATERPLTEATLVTESNQFLGTPAYMSPEQAELGERDIDTRSDVYSLGVLLYELLTGWTPFETRQLVQGGFEGLRHVLHEVEPPRPSARLGTLTATELDTLALARGLGPRELKAELRGDLDWIVMKCLEKDRTRRYPTANALAQDLQRHLAHEPVTAGPPNALYRFGKFARRNRIALTVATVIAATLITATGISLQLAFRAAHAESLATRRSTESEAITRFLTGLFQSPEPGRDGRTVTVAEHLDRAAKELETALLDQPERRVLLQATLGDTYHALGLYRDAIAMRIKVRDHYLATCGPLHPDTLRAMQALASSHEKEGDTTESLVLREQALSLRREVHGPDHAETLQAMRSLATAYRNSGRLDGELDLRRKILALSQESLGPRHPDTLVALADLAKAPSSPLREQLVHWGELLALSRLAHGDTHSLTLEALDNRGTACQGALFVQEALALREELVALRTRTLGANHPDTLQALAELKRSYMFEQRYSALEPILSASLSRAREAESDDPASLVGSLSEVAELHFRQGRFAAAEDLYLEALEACRGREGAENSVMASSTRGRLGSLLADWAWAERASRPAASLEHARRGEALLRPVLANAMEDTRFTRKRLATVHSQLGGALSVLAFLAPDRTLAQRETLLAEAEAQLLEGPPELEKVRFDQVDNYRDSLRRLVRLYDAWQRPAQATRWRLQLRAFEESRAGWE